jgi:superfamily I DNA/RNA helicase
MAMLPLDPDAIATLPSDTSCTVYAGPGTGKTRLLVRRLNFLLANPARPGGEAACITYTNAAAEEIAARLEKGVRPGFLGTIHSFLLEHVVYPYGYWLDGVPAAFDLVTTGYAAPHLQWMQSQGLISAKKAHSPDVVMAFESAGYDLDGKLKSLQRASLSEAEMKAFVTRRLASGQINQQDVLWFAWRILSEPAFAHVLDALSCRFSAILVDEFQDTSALQFAVLEKLWEKGRTALFLVGDREQSIFSFAGASLETYTRATAKLPPFPLTVNYRSTSRIVTLLNALLESECRLVPAARWKDEGIPVYVIVGKVDDVAKVRAFMELRIKHGLTGSGKSPAFLVLARGAKATRRLTALTDAKPEQGEDVFERLDKTHRQLGGILRDLLRARRLLDLGEYARAFRSLDRSLSRLILKANPGFGAPDSIGLTHETWRAMLCDVLQEMRELNAKEVAPWVESVQEAVKRAILKAGGMKSGSKLILLGKVKDHLKKKAKYYTDDALRCVDIADEVTSSVRTIHRSKGMEAEAILLVAESGDLTQWLNCHGSGKPRNEEARIGYVGLSRAMKLLCIATDTMTADVRANLDALGVVVVELDAEDQ